MKYYIVDDGETSQQLNNDETFEYLTRCGCNIDHRFDSLEGSYIQPYGDEIEVSFYDITE